MNRITDCATVLGNRHCNLHGLNFDRIRTVKVDPDQAPDLSPCAVMFNDHIGPKFGLSPIVVEGEMRNLNNVRNAAIVIEAFLVNRTGPRSGLPNCDMIEMVNKNAYEEWIQQNILSFISKTKIYSAQIDSAWVEINPRHQYNHEDELPGSFCYNRYAALGVFEFDGGDSRHSPYKDGRSRYLEPEDMFPEFNSATQQVWLRLWHRTVWLGIIRGKRYDSIELTDSCLIWTAYELDIIQQKEIVLSSRRDLWNKCLFTILKRYFPKEYHKQMFLPLLYAHKLDANCKFYKDVFPEELFLYIVSFVFGDWILKRALQSRTSANAITKKIKLE